MRKIYVIIVLFIISTFISTGFTEELSAQSFDTKTKIEKKEDREIKRAERKVEREERRAERKVEKETKKAEIKAARETRIT